MSSFRGAVLAEPVRNALALSLEVQHISFAKSLERCAGDMKPRDSFTEDLCEKSKKGYEVYEKALFCFENEDISGTVAALKPLQNRRRELDDGKGEYSRHLDILISSLGNPTMRSGADAWVAQLADNGGTHWLNDNNGSQDTVPLSVFSAFFSVFAVGLLVWAFVGLPSALYGWLVGVTIAEIVFNLAMFFFLPHALALTFLVVETALVWFWRFDLDYVSQFSLGANGMFLLFPWFAGIMLGFAIAWPVLYHVKKMRSERYGPLASLWVKRVSERWFFPAYEFVIVDDNDKVVKTWKTVFPNRFMDHYVGHSARRSLEGVGRWDFVSYPSIGWVRYIKRSSKPGKIELSPETPGFLGLAWIFRFPKPHIPQKYTGDAELLVPGLTLEVLEEYFAKHPHMPTDPPGYEEAAVKSAE